jgi:hypothetical protein
LRRSEAQPEEKFVHRQGIVLGEPNANPRKTVPIPHCLRAASSTLYQCIRAGVLVADDVCPGHFLGKFHMAFQNGHAWPISKPTSIIDIGGNS